MVELFPYLRPLIHILPPEVAHEMGITALRATLLPPAKLAANPALQVHALGLAFKNPVGLAAGFDKNAVAIDGILGQGFGFMEAGTVTPRAQPGNPMPRLFRLKEDKAVINRLGFNNEGMNAYVRYFARRNPALGIAGANIGKNKDSADAIADYVMGLKAVYPLADYVTVNISSPNTQGLRDLQKGAALNELLLALKEARQECKGLHGRAVPLLLKVAPDLELPEIEDITASAVAHGVDGLIVSNTTLSRPGSLQSRHAQEQGGLSGKPLYGLSTQVLRQFYQVSGGKLLLIGVGGIASAEDAYEKIRAGAALVQLYTALVYQGFGVVRRVVEGLAVLLERDGFSHVSEAVGVDVT